MKATWLRYLAVITALCLIFPVMAVFSATSAVSFTLSAVGDVYYGGEFMLRIAVNKPTVALEGLEFALSYNSEYVTPKVTENSYDNREMNSFFVAKPNGWEQYSYHSSEDSTYILRFAAGETDTQYLSTANGLVLEIPFVVNTPGSFDFAIATESIIALAGDSNLTSYGGTGSSVTVTAESGAEMVEVSLSGAATCQKGSQYILELDITNLGDVSGIVALELDLNYDSSVFQPVIIANNTNQMDSFITSAPQNSWEQICRLYSTESRYVLRLAAKNCGEPDIAEVLKPNESIKLSIPFTAVGQQGSSGVFSVNSSTVIGVNNVMGVLSGKGSTFTAQIKAAGTATSPQQLGYTVTSEKCLLYVRECTAVSDFLAPFTSEFAVYKGSERITDGYVCTGYALKDGNGNSYTVVVKGDVDGSGEVDLFDCLYVKAIYYNQYLPTAYEKYAAAVCDGKTISIFDYFRIKSHYFGIADLYEEE